MYRCFWSKVTPWYFCGWPIVVGSYFVLFFYLLLRFLRCLKIISVYFGSTYLYLPVGKPFFSELRSRIESMDCFRVLVVNVYRYINIETSGPIMDPWGAYALISLVGWKFTRILILNNLSVRYELISLMFQMGWFNLSSLCVVECSLLNPKSKLNDFVFLAYLF